jgi:hypothetical protein
MNTKIFGRTQLLLKRAIPQDAILAELVPLT